MKSFFSGILIIFGLFMVGVLAFSLGIVPLTIFALATTLLPLLAMFVPLKRLGLGHRGFSLAVLCLIGLPMALVTSVSRQDAFDQLREEDPESYLAQLKATDEVEYLDALSEMDPELYKTESAAKSERDAAAALIKSEEDAALAEIESAKRAQAAAEQAVERQVKIDAYIASLRNEIPEIQRVSASTFTGSVIDIMMGLRLIDRYNEMYDEGSTFSLSDEGGAVREQFATALRSKQVQFFPVLRDAYGPAMRAELWEADGWAQTKGSGYRTVSLVSAIFAANANIKETQETMREQLLMLRFTRAEYRWYKEAREYQFYTMSAPSDSELGLWNGRGTFRAF